MLLWSLEVCMYTQPPHVYILHTHTNTHRTVHFMTPKFNIPPKMTFVSPESLNLICFLGYRLFSVCKTYLLIEITFPHSVESELPNFFLFAS